ncbi:MAG TPA: hypothetical protein VKU41_05385 [Polyangiaceae bacterium]|nr:hypothetical protein [Polyangiaceae bacterium]
MSRRAELAFASPRKLPRARDLNGRVVVLDLAFASEASSGGFEKITLPFIEQLGPRLAGWVDHHDHVMHERYRGDARFVLATKAEHGACPEMVTPEVIARIGPVDTIVCHTDFDGLCSAAKWLREGVEPYPGADADARAIDTRTAAPGPLGERFDRALRARPRDTALAGLVVRHLAAGLADPSLWEPIDRAASELAPIEEATRRVAAGYSVVQLVERKGVPPSVRSLAFLDVTPHHGRYDKTLLLLLGQERAGVALVVDTDTVTVAARFDSGLSFLELLGLSGGMPTLVSIPKKRLQETLERVGVDRAEASRLAG